MSIQDNPDVIKLNCWYPRTKDGEKYHIVKTRNSQAFETECGLKMRFRDERCVDRVVRPFEDVRDWQTDFHLQFCTECFK